MRPLVYATEAYGYMQQALAAAACFDVGSVERKTFPDGERWLRVAGEVRGRDAVLIGGTTGDAATMELFDLACGLVGLGVGTLSLVIPYFGYSTQERANLKGEVVTAKTRALLLSAIPRARVSNQVVLLDLHTDGINHYFEGHLHSVHLSALPLAQAGLEAARAHGKKGADADVVVASTDAGRAKWVQKLANAAGVPAAFAYKSRAANGKLALTGVNADVLGKHVFVYDDMVRTGGSLLQAAEAYKQAGAARLTAVTTHAVLPGNSCERLVRSGLFDAFYCTDSVPQARELAARHPDFIKMQSVVPLLAQHFLTGG